MESNHPQKKLLNSVLIKPAGPDCNMACTYCFYLGKHELFKSQRIHRMSDDILKEIIRQVMQQGENQISFGWQGGEPTLMGIEFFKKSVHWQQQFGRSGQVVGNGLQTNGILINKKWASFLYEARFLVGLSLDGPQHIHDYYRRRRGGQSSWARVARARDIMLDAGVEVNALIVVNDYSVKFPEEIYQYHKKNGLSFMQFIPCIEPDPLNPGQTASYTVSAGDYGTFLCKLFDLWIGDFENGRPTTSIRWFDSLFYTYVGLPAPECTLFPECGIYVVVEHNGDIYACDFYVDPEWKLGNIMEGKLVDFLNSDLQNQFGQIKSCIPPECSGCVWLVHCWAGCPRDRQVNAREIGSNHLCSSFKVFFEYADKKFHEIAEKWIKEQRLLRAQPYLDKTGRNDPCPCGSGLKFKKCCGTDI